MLMLSAFYLRVLRARALAYKLTHLDAAVITRKLSVYHVLSRVYDFIYIHYNTTLLNTHA